MLGEILLDRSNHDIMAKYIDDPNNLKLLMNLLRDKSKNIQYEAFHVFKVSSIYLCESNAILMEFRFLWLIPGRQNQSMISF